MGGRAGVRGRGVAAGEGTQVDAAHVRGARPQHRADGLDVRQLHVVGGLDARCALLAELPPPAICARHDEGLLGHVAWRDERDGDLIRVRVRVRVRVRARVRLGLGSGLGLGLGLG